MGSGGLPVKTNYPVYQSTTIYKGSLVAVNSSGYLVPGSTSTTLICVGTATQHIDNSGGASGALYCEVFQGVSRWANGNSMTLAAVGDLCYIVDDQTVSTVATGRSPAGTVYLVDSDGVWVYS